MYKGRYIIMIQKIAFISDIHGNLEALNTVLEDIKRKNVDIER